MRKELIEKSRINNKLYVENCVYTSNDERLEFEHQLLHCILLEFAEQMESVSTNDLATIINVQPVLIDIIIEELKEYGYIRKADKNLLDTLGFDYVKINGEVYIVNYYSKSAKEKYVNEVKRKKSKKIIDISNRFNKYN